VPFAESYISILAFFLFGSVTIAIGLFVSSLTESQIISAVVSAAIIFIGFVMSGLCNLISADGNIATKILGAFDLTTPFSNLSNGTMNLTAIFYYVSLTALFLFLTMQSIQKRRYSISTQTLSMGAYNSVMIVVAFAVTIFANLLVNQIPSQYTTFDLTTEKLYSLTDNTYSVLDALNEDVTINVLATESQMDTTVAKTLKSYEDYSKHIKVKYVDPTSNPTFYQKYTDDSVTSGSLIVVSDKRSKTIAYSSLYESTMDYQTYQSTTTGYDAEGQITSAIAYVVSKDMPKIYMVTGHGEASLDATFTSAIAKLNIDYADVTLLKVDTIPDDAQAVIVNAPTSDFSSDDVAKLQKYIDQGGNVIFMYGYTTASLKNYTKLLSDNGVEIVNGMIIEDSTKSTNNFYQTPNWLLPNVESDTITSKLPSNGYVFMKASAGIKIDQKAADDGTTRYLLETSDNAFARTDVSNTSAQKASGDIDGPFALGAVVTKKLDNGKTSNIVVYSSANLFTADSDQYVSGNNQTLFTSTLSQFVNVQSSVNIPAKEYKLTQITISSANILLIALVITVVLPIALIVIGLVIWIERRKR
jgi:ABC-2 type transport system permease protein